MSKPHPLLLLLLFVLTGAPSIPVAQAAPKPLEFGFLPSRSPVTLYKHFSPLLNYLSQQIDHKIILRTATDYSSFLNNTQNRKYDFVLTAPHFALLALDTGKYLAPVTYTKGLMADILVSKNSPITQLRQLAGKKIALPPETAIIAMAGKHMLEQNGLTASRAPRYVITNSHNASVHTMLAGDATAAIVSNNITKQFVKRNSPIRKLATTGALPGMSFLVARDLSKEIRVSFTKALTEMHASSQGKAALYKMGYPGYRKSRNKEFEAARPYLNMYKESLTGKD